MGSKKAREEPPERLARPVPATVRMVGHEDPEGESPACPHGAVEPEPNDRGDSDEPGNQAPRPTGWPSLGGW
jgi:hypothetical protein